MHRFAAPATAVRPAAASAMSVRWFADVTQDVPNMGDSITEGTIIEWAKEAGDYVSMDDVVCVIETDKVSVDVRAEHSGGLRARCWSCPCAGLLA